MKGNTCFPIRLTPLEYFCVCPSSFQALSSPKLATLMMNSCPVFSATSLHLIGFSLPEKKLTHLGVKCHSPGPHLQAWCSCLLASEPSSSCSYDPTSCLLLHDSRATCSVVLSGVNLPDQTLRRGRPHHSQSPLCLEFRRREQITCQSP